MNYNTKVIFAFVVFLVVCGSTGLIINNYFKTKNNDNKTPTSIVLDDIKINSGVSN